MEVLSKAFEARPEAEVDNPAVEMTSGAVLQRLRELEQKFEKMEQKSTAAHTAAADEEINPGCPGIPVASVHAAAVFYALVRPHKIQTDEPRKAWLLLTLAVLTTVALTIAAQAILTGVTRAACETSFQCPDLFFCNVEEWVTPVVNGMGRHEW